ncbi:uncharacterized protein LOC117419627 [Acipenser ruthenus]|uniref:uncharacterized protein LOC117419627 n=1 Tax=Acipenser ruthenus TaxID=7906 RepID=UPI0027415647|nr:uncharacterized protein LOC117419627 [Acipenser ruthenus]
MKTFLLLTSLLAVVLVSQAAEGDDNQHASLDLSDTNEKREMDESDFLEEEGELDGLVDDLEQKREMGFADDADESQGEKRELEGDDNQHASLDVSDTNEKREMEAKDIKDESVDWTNENYQAQKREIDESDFLGESGELDGLVDDLEQKREMGFADDADESQGEKRELAGSENKGLQGKRWLGCRHDSRTLTCYHSHSCHHYRYRHCTRHPSPRCSKHVHLRCLIVKRHCVRLRRCHYHHYYNHKSCLSCTVHRWWKNM